jgi:hypothetical protein
MSNLSNLTEVTKEEFLVARLSQECEKESLDKAAICTLLNHLRHQGQKYYRATLTEAGFQNLIIAHHKHGDDLMVSEGGQPLADIVVKYTAKALRNECWQKVDRMKVIIAKEVQESGSIFPKSMTPFVSDVGELAIRGRGHYKQHEPECLYIGGYHRFAAYGLWVTENRFQPLNLYYCEATDTAR